MSVPRRLGAGHSDFDNGTGTCALQSRHPSGFDADKSMEAANGHTYTNGLSSTSSTHIAANQLSSLTLSAAYSPTPPAAKSPQTAYSIASTASTPGTPSPSSAFSFTSPCPSSAAPSPAAHLPPLHASAPTSASAASTTLAGPYSATASLASPITSPSPAARRPAMLKPSQSPSPPPHAASASAASPHRFISPFRSSHKQASAPLQVEAIASIMQDESPPSGGSPSGGGGFPKSPGSPRALPSPKPSPGVRAQVASPAPSPSASPSAVIAYNQLPAIDRVHRYVVTGTLQQSLFGVVKMAFDRVGRQLVAIKISRRERAQQQTTRSGVSVLENVRREATVMQYLHDRSASGNAGRCPERKKSLYADMLGHMTANDTTKQQQQQQLANGGGAGSVNGKKVKRMSSRATTQQRMQNGGDERMNIDDDGGSQQSNGGQGGSVGDSDGDSSDCDTRMSTPSLPHRISVCSASGYSTTYEVSPTHTPSFSNLSSPSPSTSGFASPSSYTAASSPSPLQQQHAADPSDVEGERYICRYVEELEDEYFHYLVTEFVPAGDLYSMLTSFPQHRLTEGQARGLFRQMVLGVKYLHVRNVAHLDMSLENMVIDMDDNVRIIDFGVSALHPFTPTTYQTNYFSFPSASSPISFPSSNNTSPDSQQRANASSANVSPTSSVSNAAGADFTPHPHRSFLCKPVKELYAKPGKIRYMSPELFQGAPWDAYANDVFSLGVILYSLLTGRPPFQQAEAGDVWFHVIYSGQWLLPNIRKQSSAHVYTHLSEPALQLINFILKPQDRRPTCEQILQHPWMQMQ